MLSVIVAMVLVSGGAAYVYHRNHKAKTPVSSSASTNTTSKTGTTSMSTITQTTATHTAQEATTFVQKTYDNYLAAINNAGANNLQPLGLVGLMEVKDN